MKFTKIASLVKGQKVIYDFLKGKESGFVFRLMSPHAAFVIPMDTDRLPDPLVGIAQPDVKGELEALFKRHMAVDRPYFLTNTNLTYSVCNPSKTLVILEGRKANHDGSRLFFLDKRFFELISDTAQVQVAPVAPGALEFVNIIPEGNLPNFGRITGMTDKGYFTATINDGEEKILVYGYDNFANVDIGGFKGGAQA